MYNEGLMTSTKLNKPYNSHVPTCYKQNTNYCIYVGLYGNGLFHFVEVYMYVGHI